MPLAVRTVTDDGDDDGDCVGLVVGNGTINAGDDVGLNVGDGVGAIDGDDVVDCNRLTMLRSFVAVSDTLLTPLVVRAALW